MRTGQLVIPLQSISNRHTSNVGGKALGLARLMKAGFPVPDGFCVTTDAYRTHLASQSLALLFNQALPDLNRLAPQDKSKTLSNVRQQIIGTPVSETVISQIAKAYRSLDTDQLAIRSSATAEDLREHSFAGQYDTFLGVTSLEQCLDAVKKCWASVWTDRAYEYRQANSIDHLKVQMAVIVQQLVPAQASGILFTADPMTGRSDHIVIEACFGLGDSLVSGHAASDRFVLAKNNLKLISQSIAEKRSRHIVCPDGSLSKQTVTSDAAAPAIDIATITKLAKLALKVERKLGCPQDIEWSVYGSDIYLLQSRPITTLRTTHTSRDRWIWSGFPAREVMPDVATPITRSLIDSFIGALFALLCDILCIDPGDVPMYDYIAGHSYFNASFWGAVIRVIPGGRTYDFASFTGSNTALIKIVGLLRNMPDEDMPKIKFNRLRFTLKIPLLIIGIQRCTPKKGLRILAETKSRYQKWEHTDVAGLSSEQLSVYCTDIISDFAEVVGNFPYMFGTMIAYLALESVCASWFSDKSLAGRLLGGIGGLDDAQAAMDLWQLAAKANNPPELKSVLLNENSWKTVVTKISTMPAANEFFRSWNEFMTCHGHHCRGELELHNPRWSESPNYILALVQSYLTCIDKTNPIQNHRNLDQHRRSLEKQCRRRLKNPLKRMFFNQFLIRSQNGAVFRENIKSEIIKVLATLRKLLIELGRRLHTANILADPDDIFFLTLEEIEPVVSAKAQFDIRNVITERRAEYNKWLSVTPPDVIVGRFDPDDYIPEQVETDVDVLKGLAVSPGVVTGKAKVILRTDSNTQLEAGEILVAPFTDPGWVPYFLPAAGLVMNQGSLLSHGSIVAREFGIPAVVNVGHATEIIKTGQTIQVDGNHGVVKILY